MADESPPAEPKTPPTKPPEGIADHDEAEVRSLAPSVCLTPCGPSMVPVPYCIWDKHGHDKNYTPTVRWRGNAAMVLRSITQHVHGDEAGTGGGVISGIRGGICEPIGHEPTVRSEGSPTIRDGDLCWMSNRNTIGVCVLKKNLGTNQLPQPRPKPKIDDRQKKIDEYAAQHGWTRADDGGWNTNPGKVGWASNDKVGEEMDYVAAHANDPAPNYGLSGPSELRSYTPSWAERVQSGTQDALESAGMSRGTAQMYGDRARTAAEWLPGTSNAISANDSARSFSSGHPVIGSIQAVGAVIGIGLGGLVEKGLVRGAEKVGQTLAEREAVKLAQEAAAKKAAQQGGVRVSLPKQMHHFATNKNKKYSPKMKELADKYGLDLDKQWNKEMLEHLGRYPNEYHDFVLKGMKDADAIAQGNRDIFLQQFEKLVKDPVRQDPSLLRKSGW